jgi:hypothetical protein
MLQRLGDQYRCRPSVLQLRRVSRVCQKSKIGRPGLFHSRYTGDFDLAVAFDFAAQPGRKIAEPDGGVVDPWLISGGHGIQEYKENTGSGGQLAGRLKNFTLSVSASTATSKNPIIISSQLCSPNRTSADGSGLFRLFAELSK